MMTTNKLLLPLLALAIFFGAIGAAQATGNWVVSGRQIYDAGNLTDGANVRGWMSLQEVADGAGIPIDELYTRLSIPESIAPDTPIKDLEGVIPDFEVTTVRDVVDEFLGISGPEEVVIPGKDETSPAGETPVPTAMPVAATAVPIPTILPSSTVTHVPLGDGSGDQLGSGPTPLPPGEVLAAVDIKGRSTLQEIVDQADVPADALLAALGLPADTDMHTALKDLAADGRIAEVDTVRLVVAELQAR